MSLNKKCNVFVDIFYLNFVPQKFNIIFKMLQTIFICRKTCYKKGTTLL